MSSEVVDKLLIYLLYLLVGRHVKPGGTVSTKRKRIGLHAQIEKPDLKGVVRYSAPRQSLQSRAVSRIYDDSVACVGMNVTQLSRSFGRSEEPGTAAAPSVRWPHRKARAHPPRKRRGE